jgi:hypothetical protein
MVHRGLCLAGGNRLQVVVLLVTCETLRASRASHFVDLRFCRLLLSSHDRHLSSVINCSVKVCYDYYELNNEVSSRNVFLRTLYLCSARVLREVTLVL